MKDFLRTVLPSSGWYFLATPHAGGSGWAHRGFQDLDFMAETAAAFALDRTDVYFACAAYTHDRYVDDQGKTRRRTRENAERARSFWLDIDCGDKKAASGDGYVDAAQAISALERFVRDTDLPDPLIVSSGGGLHVYWPLTDDIPKARWLEVATQLKQLTRHPPTRLLADDSRTTDIASVLRPIGTRNWKPERNGAPVELIANGQRVDVDEFQRRIHAAMHRAGFLTSAGSSQRVSGNLGAAIASGLPAPAYSAPTIVRAGGRNAALLAHVGHLRRSGVPEDHILGIARDFNLARFVPPLDDDEVMQVVSRYAHQGHVVHSKLDVEEWPDPLAVKAALPSVPAFDLDLLPDVIKPVVADASELMQCPPDFLAVSYMVCAAAALGLTISIAPKALDTSWLVPPVLWGAIIGRPGAKKSPAISKALGPIKLIEAELALQHAARLATYEAQRFQYDLLCEQAKKAARSGLPQPIPAKPQEPQPERILVNDTTYQALGEALRWSPRGLLVQMDELTGLLSMMDTAGQEAARAFYLQGWNGNEAYRFGRIGRESFMIDRLAICVLGGIQPDRLRDYVSQAVHGGGGDDGLMQRFQLAVWPDVSTTWTKVDRAPDFLAIEAVDNAFGRLRQLKPADIGAKFTLDGKTAYLHFSPDAQQHFDEAWILLEGLVRSRKLETAAEAHFSKYPRMIAILALLIHLIDGGSGPVDLVATKKAVRWAVFLSRHALRIYGSASSRAAASAHTLAKQISQGKLGTQFSARQVSRRGWRNLTSSGDVEAALDQLIEKHWISAEDSRPDTVGRRSARYIVNPKVPMSR